MRQEAVMRRSRKERNRKEEKTEYKEV